MSVVQIFVHVGKHLFMVFEGGSVELSFNSIFSRSDFGWSIKYLFRCIHSDVVV